MTLLFFSLLCSPSVWCVNCSEGFEEISVVFPTGMLSFMVVGEVVRP